LNPVRHVGLADTGVPPNRWLTRIKAIVPFLKKNLMCVAVIIIVLLTVGGAATADSVPDEDSVRVSGMVNDSVMADIRYKSLFVERGPDSTGSQRPTTALFKSMLVPGWGQVGNKKYIKAVIFAGLESLAFGTYWHYRTKTSDARAAFESAGLNEQGMLFREYENARSERNRFAWYTGSLIFISMFDAYVDAHLVHFPKRDESISLRLVPTEDAHPALALSYNF